MDAANGASKSPNTVQQPGLNGGANMPAQNWMNVGYQVPGLTMPSAGQHELQKLAQVKISCSSWIFIFYFFFNLLKRTYHLFYAFKQVVTSQSMQTAGNAPSFPSMRQVNSVSSFLAA